MSYSAALFELAVEKDCLDNTKSSLEQLKFAIHDTNLLELLASPCVSLDNKLSVLSKAFDDDELLLGFLSVMIQRNNTNDLITVIDEFMQRYDEFNKITHVTVTSAVLLHQKFAEQIQNVLRKMFNEIVISFVVDETIIAGLIIQAGDKIIDCSINNRLQNFKERLTELDWSVS